MGLMNNCIVSDGSGLKEAERDGETMMSEFACAFVRSCSCEVMINKDLVSFMCSCKIESVLCSW